MARDYLQQPITSVRRSDRAVEDEAWLKQFLHRASVGALATVHDGQPFINTNLFVYDELTDSIITHTANTGRTRANVDAHEKVCFTVMEMGRLLPDKEALEFSVEYGGVVIFGLASVVKDEAEGLRMLQLLMDKYAPHLQPNEDYRPPIAEELKRTAVYQIKITEWSAKKKEVGAFAGAYWYPERPMLKSVQTRIHWQGKLEAIYIAPAGGEPVQAVESVEAIAGKGLVGDRYYASVGTFSDVEGTGREITLVAQEDITDAIQESGLALEAHQTRRNLITLGVPLNHLVGKKFRVGEVILEGIRLCEPCDTLAKKTELGKPLITALLHRAGLRANILQGGIIRAGDTIQPCDEPEI